MFLYCVEDQLESALHEVPLVFTTQSNHNYKQSRRLAIVWKALSIWWGLGLSQGKEEFGGVLIADRRNEVLSLGMILKVG